MDLVRRFCKTLSLHRLAAALVFVVALSQPAFSQNGGEWGWMTGINTLPEGDTTIAVYGTMGVAAAGNTPGGRGASFTWTDQSGNFWLYSGGALTTSPRDLWEFNPSTTLWTWMAGDIQLQADYGVQGVAAATNTPGGRYYGSTSTGADGKLWLFGGVGFADYLNDLWSFDPNTVMWTWEKGSNTASARDQNSLDGSLGVYGTQGIAAAGNTPSGRSLPISWQDSNGRFWLFGGYGFDANSITGWLNDLWMFDPSSGEWTWEAGNNTLVALDSNGDYGRKGAYGTRGQGSKKNLPGSRYAAQAWVDSKGIFWIFAGLGADSNGVLGPLNDLWSFDPSSREWTWVAGNDTTNNIPGEGPGGTYGTKGTLSASNYPGGRVGASTWTDWSGDLWLFGGNGFDANNYLNNLNDLWVYSPSTGEWGWMDGSSTAALYDNGPQPGVFGTMGQFAPENTPGGNDNAMAWTDSSGNLWLFGGLATDSQQKVNFMNAGWEYRFTSSFALSSSVSSLSISAGEQGTSTLTVAPLNGFNSAVSFTCSGLPSGATCAFSPTTVTPLGKNSVTTQLTIAVSSSASMAKPRARPFVPYAALAILFGSLGIGLRRRRLSRWMLFLIAALPMLAVISACGGGSTAGGGGGGTNPPPETANVTVTATAGGLQQSTTIALTVN